MRRSMLLAVATIILAGGCNAETAEPERADTVTFLENQSAFAGFVGGGFSMNLLFRTPPGTVAPEVTDARFLPEASWFEVTDVSVNENIPDGQYRRWALGVTARGRGPGTQEFRDIELDTGEGVIRAPIGTVRVEIVEGASPVEEPDRPVNLEARPILLVERDGETRYTGLHNMVIRKDAAIEG